MWKKELWWWNQLSVKPVWKSPSVKQTLHITLKNRLRCFLLNMKFEAGQIWWEDWRSWKLKNPGWEPGGWQRFKTGTEGHPCSRTTTPNIHPELEVLEWPQSKSKRENVARLENWCQETLYPIWPMLSLYSKACSKNLFTPAWLSHSLRCFFQLYNYMPPQTIQQNTLICWKPDIFASSLVLADVSRFIRIGPISDIRPILTTDVYFLPDGIKHFHLSSVDEYKHMWRQEKPHLGC